MQKVDDGSSEQDGRAVGDGALAGETRVGDENERVEREARQQQDGVRDADERECRVQLTRRARVHVTSLPRVVDLTQLVGAAPALRQQLHGAREHDEVRQHLSDDEPRRRHAQPGDVAIPVVDVQSSRVAQPINTNPLAGC